LHYEFKALEIFSYNENAVLVFFLKISAKYRMGKLKFKAIVYFSRKQ